MSDQLQKAPIRVLWVSLRIFAENEETQTAVWLKALAKRLISSPEIILGNVSCKSGISDLIECDFSNIKQWAIPFGKVSKKGIPSKQTRTRLGSVINIFKPDIIQIWGSENFFKLLPFDNSYPGIKVLTMQGVLGSIAPNLLLGLSLNEKISTLGIRELITLSSIFTIRKSFAREGEIEKAMIRKSDFIITQSDWTDSQIRSINSNSKLYRTHRVLRDPFINCEKWDTFDHEKPVLYSAAIGYTLKGLHILIKALAIVKIQFPDVELRLAGAIGRRDFLADGYFRLILKMIKKYNLENNITWLGPVNATQIVENLQHASVYINPSFVESYSLAFAEAMSIGTPSVISFAGAMPELAENNKEALFFTPADYKRCADLITELLRNKELALLLSNNAIIRSENRNLKFDIVSEQIEIYRDILSQKSGSKLSVQ